MKLIKLMGMTACLALASMAFVGVSSAMAHTVVELCEEGDVNCHEAPAGTTFTASGSEIDLAVPEIGFHNLCETSQLEGEVNVALSASENEEIDAEITEAQFENCELEVLTEGLPWLLTTNDALFSENLTLLVSGGVAVIIHTPFGPCLFEETSEDMVGATWLNANPSVIHLSGSLVSPSCLGAERLGEVTGSYTVTSVNGQPGDIVILHS